MILRRLVANLREQHWTGVFIELVIVVLGVFIGMQVTNWNQQRLSDQQSAIYTQHLRDDLRQEAVQLDGLKFYYDEVLANARRALDDLEGRAPLSNEALVIAAYRASQYADYVQQRGTYDELVSTGNIGLITDLTLRRMAIEVYGTKLYDTVRTEGINSQYRTAFRMMVPIKVQDAVGAKCGDLPSFNNYSSSKGVLDYPCTTGLPQQDIDAAAAALRGDSTLAALLRLRIANAQSAVGTTVITEDVMKNLKSLSGDKP